VRKNIRVNPWLKIPAFEYEGHMNDPDVDQLSFLSGFFRDSLKNFDCTSVAVLGAATGNGFEHVKNDKTKRITAVDINNEYLNILKHRYGNKIAGLEIVNDDIEFLDLAQSSFTLIFAALIFEYLKPGFAIQKISKWLNFGGVCVVVLQLPGTGEKKITKTLFKSLELLDPIMNLVNPEEFKEEAKATGLKLIQERELTLPGGKSFYTGCFERI
jgi:SAM-dependent methyltransferase